MNWLIPYKTSDLKKHMLFLSSVKTLLNKSMFCLFVIMLLFLNVFMGYSCYKTTTVANKNMPIEKENEEYVSPQAVFVLTLAAIAAQ